MPLENEYGPGRGDENQGVDGLLLDFLDSQSDDESSAGRDRPAQERRSQLEQLCRQHPGQSMRLRRLHGLLERFGMLDEPGDDQPGDGDRGFKDLARERVGSYRILEVLGVGGMGVVYLAEHERLGRRVALKVIHSAMADAPRARERFRREALAASRLDHPGICAVYEAGESDGTAYLAMRHVDASTLASLITASKAAGAICVELPRAKGIGAQDAILGLCERVADALHAAHEAGLVHRDVKPANLMVTRTGEPVLLDFGLASLADTDDALTRTGDQLGTAFYMAPEQVRGRSADRRTDVYALGVVLYECLTLERPFEASNRHDLFSLILREPPPRPRHRGIGADLWTVVESALCKDPERRYGDARAFGDDLRRVRAHEPILARRPGPWLRVRLFARRHPVAGAFVAFLVATVIAFAVLLRQYQGALATSNAALEHVTAVGTALRAGKVGRAAPAQGLAMALEAFDSERNFETVSALYGAFVASRERARLHHSRAVRDAHFAPAGDLAVTCSDDRTARLWRPDGRMATAPLWHLLHVHECRFSDDGSRLLTRSPDGTVGVWSPSGDRQQLLRHGPMPSLPYRPSGPLGPAPRAAEFSPDGRRVATCSLDGVAKVWEVATGEQVGADFVEHRDRGGAPASICWSADGRLVATAERHAPFAGSTRDPSAGREELVSCDVIVWRPGRDRHEVVAVLPHPHGATSAEFDHSGTRLLTACMDGRWRIWSWAEAAVVEAMAPAPPGRPLNRACYAPGGDRVLTSATDGAVSLWSTAGGIPLAAKVLPDDVTAVFAPDGSRIVTYGKDAAVRLFDLGLNELIAFRGHTEQVEHAEISPDGRRVISASWDRTARIWDVFDPLAPHLLGHTARIVALAHGEAGAVVSIGDDFMIRVWDLATGAVRTLPVRPYRSLAAAGSSGGRRLAVASADGHGRIYDLRSGHVREVATGNWRLGAATFVGDDRLVLGGQPPRLHVVEAGATACQPFGGELTDRTVALAHSPVRGVVAAAGWSPVVTVHDEQGALLSAWEARALGDWIQALQFSPDGMLLAVGGSDRTVTVWDLRDLSRAVRAFDLVGHAGRITSLAWSGDGRLLASGSSDGSARLWRIDDREAVAELVGHGGDPVTALLFTADGRFLLTGGGDGAIQAWPATVDRLVPLARQRVARVRSTSDEITERPVDDAIAARDAMSLNDVAWRIVDPARPQPDPDLDLALRAAERAVEFSGQRSAQMLDTLARVWFWKRDYARAAAIQERAVAAERANPAGGLVMLESVLAEYQALAGKAVGR